MLATTSKPRRASSRAVARPSPRLAPVTSATPAACIAIALCWPRGDGSRRAPAAAAYGRSEAPASESGESAVKGSRQDDQRAEELSHELAGGVDRAAADPAQRLPFVAVPTARFVLMSLATFSLYQIWWFYQNWSRVKQRTACEIRPFWRAVFSPLFCYQLVKTVRSTSEKLAVPAGLSAGTITGLYLVLLLCERLPDSWWWLSLASFAPLIPVVRQIEALHAALYPGFDCHVRFGRGHVLALALCLPLSGLALLGSFGPPTRALYGSELPDRYRASLIELGHVERGERVLFFYSAGYFSIAEDGNLLTDRRVISYETRDGELWRESVAYEGIREVEVAWSQSALEETVVTV